MQMSITEIPRFITALMEWLSCLIVIAFAPGRESWKKVIPVTAIMLVIQMTYMQLTAGISGYLWIVCMFFAVMLMYFYILLCVQCSLKDVAYYGMHAFITAEFEASYGWPIFVTIYRTSGLLCLSIFAVLLFWVATYFIIWKLFSKQKHGDQSIQVTARELYSLLLITVSVFTISNLSFALISTSVREMYDATIGLIRSIVDLAGIAMIYAHCMFCIEERAIRELHIVENMLQKQYLQYEQSKESIELLNYKYHDMKQQIAVLRAEEDAGRRSSFLDQMEEEIHLYETQYQTGNHVIDVILKSKNMVCDRYHISLNCVMDGSALNFIETADICSILGNALDNAIECEQQIIDEKKRLICVALFRQKALVILRVENYFEGKLEMEGEIPRSTKKDRDNGFHGFGIGSIKYTVEKYGGVVSIRDKKSWFELEILIPLPDSQYDE